MSGISAGLIFVVLLCSFFGGMISSIRKMKIPGTRPGSEVIFSNGVSAK